MDTKIIEIDINEWQEYGNGGTARVYIKKDDNTVILKLFKEEGTEKLAEQEFNNTNAICDRGIPCPKALSLATDGNRFGIIAERLIGKRSFSRMLSEDISCMDEICSKFATLAHELHDTECDVTTFTSTADYYRRLITESAIYSEKLKGKLLSYVDEMETSTTCLHGDLTISNIVTAAGKDFWIDLGNFGYGDPYLDLGRMYAISHWMPDKYFAPLFHLEMPVFRTFVEKFLKCYLGEEYGLKRTEERLIHAGLLNLLHFIEDSPRSAQLFLPVLEGKRIKASLIRFIANHLSVSDRAK